MTKRTNCTNKKQNHKIVFFECLGIFKQQKQAMHDRIMRIAICKQIIYTICKRKRSVNQRERKCQKKKKKKKK